MHDYVYYKEFATNKERTLSDYVSFYRERFPSLFRWFYPSMRDDGFVPYAVRSKNQGRRFNEGTASWSPNFLFLPSSFGGHTPERPKDELGVYTMSSCELYFFSASVFFRALIPQVIWKVAGKDAWFLFCKATAWPVMSAGMGGFVSAEQWIYESDRELFPMKEESPYYNSLLDIILGFHKKELSELLEGSIPCADLESFSKLNEVARDKVGPIMYELSAATEAAKEHFGNGERPIYYLQKDDF